MFEVYGGTVDKKHPDSVVASYALQRISEAITEETWVCTKQVVSNCS